MAPKLPLFCLQNFRLPLLAALLVFLLLNGQALAQNLPSKLEALLPKMPATVINALPTSMPQTQTVNTSAPASPAKSETPPAATSAQPVSKTTSELPDWRGSVMFSLADMEQIHQLLESFHSGMNIDLQIEGEEDYLATISNDNSTQPPPYQFPNFYLSSIVYAAANEWTVWVSGHKLDASGKFKNERLKVASLSKNQATITWTPAPRDLTELRKNWTKKNASTTAGNWKLNPAIAYSGTEGTVTFTLRPNQHFSVEKMEIVEGKAPPQIILQPDIPAPKANSTTPLPVEEENPAAAALREQQAQAAAALEKVARHAKDASVDLGPILEPATTPQETK